MIRVLIADDQMLIRQGIRTLLEMDRGISVVGETADGAATIARVLATSVDVLLLDIRMPGGRDRRAARTDRARRPAADTHSHDL